MVAEYFLLPKLATAHRPFGKWPHVFILLKFVFSFFSNRISQYSTNFWHKNRLHNPLINSCFAAILCTFVFVSLFLGTPFAYLVNENNTLIGVVILMIFFSTLLESSFLNLLSTFPPTYRLSFILGGPLGELWKEILTFYVMKSEPSDVVGVIFFLCGSIVLLMNWLLFCSLERNPSFQNLAASPLSDGQNSSPQPLQQPSSRRTSFLQATVSQQPPPPPSATTSLYNESVVLGKLKKDDEHFKLKVFSLIYDIFGSLMLNSALSYILNPTILVSLHPFSHSKVVWYRCCNSFSMIIGRIVGTALPLLDCFNPQSLAYLRSNRLGLRLLLAKRKESSSDNISSPSATADERNPEIRDSLILKIIGNNRRAFHLLYLCICRTVLLFGIVFFGNIAVRFDRRLMKYEFSMAEKPRRPDLNEAVLYCIIFVFSLVGSWINVVSFMYSPMRVGSKCSKRHSVQYLLLAKSFGPVLGIIVGNCIFIFLMLVIQKREPPKSAL